LRCRLENVRDIASVRESQRDNWKKRTESAERRLAEAEQELKHRCVCRFTSGGVLKKTLCEFHQRLQNKAERASFVKAALAIAGKRSKAPPSVQGDYFVGFNDGIDAGTAAIRALIPKEADRG
jgi:polynucleotide 5'-kinase involved in rRNA processing